MTGIDWEDVRLVVFDMDGTLYDQPPLRRTMAWELGQDCLRQRSLRAATTLRRYRRVREELGAQAGTGADGDFMARQYALTAQSCGCSEDEVRALVEEWMERRPLPHLPRFRARGVDRLFRAIRSSGRLLAVWSDYPVEAKLQALELDADFVIWSGEDGVGRLKPDPSGLGALMDRAGVGPRHTLVIGDRVDRDGAAAHAIGAPALIRSSHATRGGMPTFRTYDDPVFDVPRGEGGHG